MQIIPEITSGNKMLLLNETWISDPRVETVVRVPIVYNNEQDYVHFKVVFIQDDNNEHKNKTLIEIAGNEIKFSINDQIGGIGFSGFTDPYRFSIAQKKYLVSLGWDFIGSTQVRFTLSMFEENA
jgi:hypothetical protein